MSCFADALRSARRAAGLTQEQLGFELDVTKSAISAWENGREHPSFQTLLRLRSVLPVSLDALLEGNLMLKKSALSEREEILLQRFRNMSTQRQIAFLEIMKPEY